ncbi:peptide/nickel transport system substrate-binding protein [Kineococcus xinjiangensis]|uniref:Peptide/nickel transport system substrate-binding protein n=1 Tax=Kineococcus xinjiangensis TaxID=512762 RepID=A0A2S6IU60_9ACTN|nr:ABC transporter substrate-binding protein [Kineococcus xinjiangensis]PPK97789.1 peptide/nickel transport system substrate-binding protein [Kineococcus xinjiangensis]
MRALPAIAALTAAALGLAGCGAGEGVDTGQGSGGSPGEGGGALVAAISAQPDQLDPHKTTAYASFQVLENVYDTLTVPSAEDQTMQPSLAESWETSDDGLTWTFTLREGVEFHDGSELDAADVVYSFNRIIDEELANSYRFTSVADITAKDDRTVVFQLKEPMPNLLSQVGEFKGMAILPEGAAEEHDLATEAVGTGPFTLQGSTASAVELKAFEDHWGGEPTVPAVEFRFVSEPTAALTALRSGQVHWTDNVPAQQIEALASDDSVELGQTPSVDYWYMAMNLEKPPFDKREVRRAIATAIDREAVTQAAKFDAARPNQTAIPEGSFWHTDYEPFEPDIAAAKKMLADAGVSTPLRMGLMVTSEYPETVTAAQVIASQLEPLGITVDIQTEEFATWLARQGEGDFDAFLLGWVGNVDPYGFYHSQHRTGASNNYQGYSNPVTDELLDGAAVERDQDARKKLYDEAAKTIVDDVSYLYLYNPDVVQAWKPGLQGYTIRADKAVNFENVELPE